MGDLSEVERGMGSCREVDGSMERAGWRDE